MGRMELKHVLNPADDDTDHRPHKRQSRSPSSGHLHSSPDVYETSWQPASAKMGAMFSYFDDQSSPSPTPPPRFGIDDFLGSRDGKNYTYNPEPDLPEGAGFEEDLSPHDNLDPQLNANGHLQPEQLDNQDDHLPPNTLLGDLDPLPTTDTLPSDSADHDDLDTDGPPLTAEALADPNTRLTDLSDAQRQQYYANLWADKEVELKDFNLPKLHLKYPQFASEIWNAYNYYTTFSVKIWCNYDSHARDFFWRPSNRLDDCGKVYLTPNQRHRLESLIPGIIQMMNIRFDIGTPFRDLFRVSVCTAWEEVDAKWGLDVRGWSVEDNNGRHDDLSDVVSQAIKNIKNDGLGEGRIGLTLQDLDEIAKDFVLPESKARPRPVYSHWFH